ncbi:lipopolysaccharide biosynthesis protein [Hoeflea sp.]|uniref:lipopolysaccharide biosynthesis protein n=1 Tax=Hoeflea sp. TaxID=1940281 RepID=UPI003B011834
MIALLTKISGLTLARLLGALVTFAITIVIARQFGTDELAIYAVCISVANLAAVAIPLGLQSLAPVEIAKMSAFPDRSAIRDFISHGRRVIARSFLVTTLLALLFAAAVFLTGKASEYTAPAVIAVMALAPIMALNQLHGGVLIGLQKPFSGQLADGLVKPLVTLAVLLAAVAAFQDRSMAAILLAIGLGAVAAMAIQVRTLKPQMAGPTKTHAPNAGTRRDWSRRSRSWLGITLCWDYQIEILLLACALIAAPLEIALLHVCFRIRVLIGFGIRALYVVLQPKIFQACAKGDRTRTKRLIGRLNGVATAYIAASIAALLVAAEHVLGLFNPDFSAYGNLLLVICSAAVLRAIFGPSITVLASHERQGEILALLAVGVASSVALAFVLYPLIGVLGIAVAYCASVMMAAVGMWLLAKLRCDTDTAIWANSLV